MSKSQSVATMLRGYSVEISPTSEKVVASALERLEPGTEVYLTWIPGEDVFRAVAPAGALRKKGLFPVPHIGARHLESVAQLENLLGRFAGEGVDRVLPMGGDREKPLGPFDATIQVMQTGLLQKHNIMRVGISGFPEGHPKLSEQVPGESTVAKMKHAREIGLDGWIVTQFVFEGAPIAGCLKRIRALGVD